MCVMSARTHVLTRMASMWRPCLIEAPDVDGALAESGSPGCHSCAAAGAVEGAIGEPGA
jgi:hypothetical protein